MPAEQPFTMGHGHPGLGQPCTACLQPLQAGEEVVACPRCKQLHHVSCWAERGGCARRGCPQVAVAIRSDRPRITDDDRAKEYARPLPKWLPWAGVFLALFVVFGIPLLQKYVFADKRPKITVMLPQGTDEPLVQAVADAFAASHPELQVSVVTAPQGAFYQQKLFIMIGARDAPDIFLLPYAAFAQYAAQGLYADLTEWVASRPEALAALPPERLQRGQVDGVWYGVPHPGRALYFGVYAHSPLVGPAIELLEQIIAALPVNENVEDVFYVEPYVPVVPRL